jgi:hypothetical protein
MSILFGLRNEAVNHQGGRMAGGRSWLHLLLLLLLGGWVRTTPTPTTSSQIERPPTESEEVTYTK